MISKLGPLARACFSILLWPVSVSLFAWLSCFASARARRFPLLRSIPLRRRPRRPTTSRFRPPPRKKNGRARARTRRATGAYRGARTARLPVRYRRVLRRASGASSDMQPARLSARRTARLPTCNRRVSRRAERRVSRRAERRVSWRAERRVSRRAIGAFLDAQTSASSGAQPARFYGMRSFCILNWSVWTLVLLLWYLSGWATFVLNHRLSAVNRES